MPIEKPDQTSRKRRPFPFAALLICLALGAGALWWLRSPRKPITLATLRANLPPLPQISRLPQVSSLPSADSFILKSPPVTRPYGMAPQAFAAFMRACNRMKVSPYRIGQTIGNHPRSVGYHQRDGVLKVNGQNIDYCAAVDLGAQDMTPAQIQRFLDIMAWEGFAVWYRSGPKWVGGEHIHAIYGSLKMKPQLQGQVYDFLRERRRSGKPRLRWERQFRKLN